MPSSPAEPVLPAGGAPDTRAPQSADAVLRLLAQLYEQALVAVAADDFDGCAAALTAADELLAAKAAPAADAATLPARRAEAQAAQARLHTVLRQLRDEVGDDLVRARTGRKALAGYAGERSLGDRVETRA